MPRSSRDWVGAEALWITAAGWSAAAQRRFGKAWVMTTDRIAAPEEVIHYPLGVNASAVVANKKGKAALDADVFQDVSEGRIVVAQEP